MVGDEEAAEPARQGVFRPVPKRHGRILMTGNTHRGDESVHRYLPEDEDRRDPLEQAALPDEPVPAGSGLAPRRLVVGGSAPDDGGHPGAL